LKGEKRVRNHLEKKEKELIGFLKREFNIGYHVGGSQMISQKQQVAWQLKCFEVTKMAWVRTSVEIFFINIFQNLQKRAGLGLIRVGIRVNQGCLQHCLTFRYIKIEIRVLGFLALRKRERVENKTCNCY